MENIAGVSGCFFHVRDRCCKVSQRGMTRFWCSRVFQAGNDGGSRNGLPVERFNELCRGKTKLGKGREGTGKFACPLDLLLQCGLLPDFKIFCGGHFCGENSFEEVQSVGQVEAESSIF